jgi:hypothetical protein
VTTGQNTAVTDRTPETPSSTKLTTGFPPPPVAAVESGRAAARPACVARATANPHAGRHPPIEIERARGRERQQSAYDRRNGQTDHVQHVIHDGDLVPDEVGDADDTHDPEDDRVAESVPGGGKFDQIGVSREQADADERDVRVETGRRRETERGEIPRDPFHG